VGVGDGTVLEKSMVPAEGRTRKIIKWMFQAVAVIPRREWTPEYLIYFMHKLVKKNYFYLPYPYQHFLITLPDFLTV
jgi:hypothetical protein